MARSTNLNRAAYLSGEIDKITAAIAALDQPGGGVSWITIRGPVSPRGGAATNNITAPDFSVELLGSIRDELATHRQTLENELLGMMTTLSAD